MLLYYKAVADPNNVDQAMLQEARTVVEKGLTSDIKPKESFYQLLLALQQQQNDLSGSAEILELLLKNQPNKKDQWQMLLALYLQLSEKVRDKDPTLGREYLVRAIVTAERAQALGFLNGPKENMTLLSLYLMANQFTKGTELLYNGMKKKTIESEPHNWRILGRYYQEANMNEQAIAVLKEATALFPKNGELEVQIAQIYLQMEKTKDAFEHAKAAIAKGNLEGTKPYGVHYLVAYTAYELGRIEDADKALAEAEKFEESKKDPQFSRLKEVVKEAIAEREAKEKAKDEPQKKGDKATPVKKAASL
jgi:tetratricopeptide (TPR) repeat protein